MLERIQNVLKNRKQDDKGFSLVELAVVIVVIGILVAIAVPVFANIQTGAERARIEAAAANGSSMQAAHYAAGETGAADFDTLNASGDVTVSLVSGATGLDSYCVQAVGTAGTATKGTAATCNTTTW